MNKLRRTAVAAIAVVFVILPGCASKPAPAPVQPVAATPAPQPASLSEIKSELLATKSQLQMTNDSLNKLSGASAADAQPSYNAFTEEFIKLQARADAVSARAEDLKKKASDYYAMWNRQVEVENPDLRRQAVQQKTGAEKIYNSITSDMELARISFKPYVANLKDIGNYLRGNVTPANLASIKELVTKSNAQAKEVDGRIAAIVESVDKIASATGEGQAKP